jgi:hypothetical protein
MTEQKVVQIKPFKFQDKLTGQKIEIRATPYYSMLSIDSRKYYFIKETGEFDGTSFQVKEN